MTEHDTPLDDDASHILVIDDDRRIRDLLSRFLSERGFRVTTASDASHARRHLTGLSFDLLIVDVMMPGEQGTDLTRSLREELDVPVLMLTALGEVEARVRGLESGADDYLPKPFDPRELLLRVNAILRRSRTAVDSVPDSVSFGPYTFLVSGRELRRNGESVRLTDREREILFMLSRSAPDVVSRYDLAGSDGLISERAVDVQMNRLRQKIESDSSDPVWLQTVRGIGYRLHVD